MDLRRPTGSLITLVTLLVAAGLRVYRLSGQSLWSDEGNSVALAGRSFAEIARRTAFDIHPPLYYWLLKIWVTLFGNSEIGLRSLSVVLGVILVYLIGLLGTRLFSPRVGRVAALIAALSPLQVYYAQEARMYMLLTVLGTLTVLLAVALFKRYVTPPHSLLTPLGIFYILTVTAGLYTHYAYPLILIVVNLAALYLFWRHQGLPLPNLQSPISNLQSPLLHWLLIHLLPLLLYLPWLPIAWRQITTWPSERQALSSLQTLEAIATTLLVGLSWPFGLESILLATLILLLLTTLWIARSKHYVSRFTFRESPLILLWLWLLLPVILTFLIFSPAFLKFLLVATPPLALLFAVTVAWLIFRLPTPSAFRPTLRYSTAAALLLLIVAASLLSLDRYYHDPTYARDNYRGIVNFIKAVGGPEDAVILNAEGQQDVFNYYYDRRPRLTAPVYPLPRQRPLDEAATLDVLQRIAAEREKIYAVYWATEQADPTGLIENWLDGNLFKATDQWYGNVRLVSYAAPVAGQPLELTPVEYQLGADIRLTGFGLVNGTVSPGDILQVVLEWETMAALAKNYTVFVQLLDPANHLVGQRDASPLTPTTAWPVGEPVRDAHGLFIEPGTPPGQHRLIVGLYDSATGQRLPLVRGGDFIDLTGVEIVRPAGPLPREAFNIQRPFTRQFFGLTLLGYDLYKVGHRSAPETPLHAGDWVQVVAYWRAEQPLEAVSEQLLIQIRPVGEPVALLTETRLLAGVDYPPSKWQVGDIVRAQYSFPLAGLEPGRYEIAFGLAHDGTDPKRVVLEPPFWIE